MNDTNEIQPKSAVNSSSPAPSDPATDQSAATAAAEGTIDSRLLFRNRREVLIQHGEELYRLRLTKSGKLILHK